MSRDDGPTRDELADDLDRFRFPPLPTGLHTPGPAPSDEWLGWEDDVVEASKWLRANRHSRPRRNSLRALPSHRTACYTPDGQLDCIGPPCPANRNTH